MDVPGLYSEELSTVCKTYLLVIELSADVRRETAPIGALVAVVVVGALVLVLVLGALGDTGAEGSPREKPGHLDVTEVPIGIHSVSEQTATLTIDAKVEHGGSATENVSVLIRAIDGIGSLQPTDEESSIEFHRFGRGDERPPTIGCSILALVALFHFYTNATQAISLWVEPRYEPIIQSMFALVVLLAGLDGVSLTVREIPPTGSE